MCWAHAYACFPLPSSASSLGASTTVPANDFLEQSTTVSTAHSTEHRGMLKCLRLVFGHCTFPAVQIAKAGGGCFRQFPPGQMKQLP